MPRAIQPLLPPRPVQRATPQPKLETERPESFEDALKSATKPAQPAAKAPDKPKPAAKSDSKATATKTTKSIKPKSTKPHDADTDVESLDDSTDTEEVETNAQATPQPADPEDAAATAAAAPKPKSDEADDDTGIRHDPTDPDATSTDLAANAQIIQPVDRAKDQAKQQQNPTGDNAAADAADVEAKPTPTGTKGYVQPVPHRRPPRSEGVEIPYASPHSATDAAPDAADAPTSNGAPANAPAVPSKAKTGAAATTVDQAIPTPAVAVDSDASLPIPDAADLPPSAPTAEKPPAKKSTDAPTPPTVSPLGLQQGAPLAPANTPTTAKPQSATSTPVAATAADITPPDDLPAPAKSSDKSANPADDFDLALASHFAPDAPPSHTAGAAETAKPAPAPPPPSPEVEFAQANHDNIVAGVQGQLLPHGGTMQIRLDPPELGALTVQVEMRDGVMNATFQTSNENATQLLSHSLNQLKHVLETQGVSVERLQVQQAPKNDPSHDARDNPQQQQQHQADDHAARQEQQRKELLRRMWRKVSGVDDPIDYLA